MITVSSLLLPVLFLALTGLSPEGGPEHTRARANLYDAVHSVSSETAQYVRQAEEWVEGVRGQRQIDTYDRSGRLVEQVLYNPDGSHFQRKVRSYSQSGRPSQEIVYAPDGSLWHRMVWTYDEHGAMTTAARYEADGTILSKELFSYNGTLSKPAESISQDKDETFFGHVVYRYDTAGRMVERSWVDDERKPVSRNVYAYDARGNLVTIEVYDRQDALMSRWVYRYDDKRNRTEWLDYHPDGSLAGRQVYRYEFDERGNWTKKVIADWVGDAQTGALEPSEVIHRTLRYYPAESPEHLPAGHVSRSQEKALPGDDGGESVSEAAPE
jgi:hypothetical protein